MTEPSRAKAAAQRRRIARKTQRNAAPPRSAGILATLEAHPFVALGVVLVAGAALASALTRPDPRRVAQALTPLISPLMAPLLAAAAPAHRHWWESLLPGSRRTWRDDVADQARARWRDAPSRRWWEDQLDQLRGAIQKYLPQA
jgi:hypothetical protein